MGGKTSESRLERGRRGREGEGGFGHENSLNCVSSKGGQLVRCCLSW